MRALYTSATGMTAQQFNLDVIANNLANASTHGFKKASAHFQDLLYQNMQTPGAGSTTAQSPTGTEVGLGVSLGTTNKLFTQGTIQSTGNDYDLAISGDGFFKVLMPDGTTAYTRDGSFSTDSQGRLVTANGYAVQPEIIVPSDKTSIMVAADGTVSVTRQGQTNSEQIGQLQLTRFVNPAGLQSVGDNLYKQSAASGDPIDDTPGQNGLGTLIQKSLESGNVDIVSEMINMITVQRAYETNSKAVQASDEMLQTANNLKR